MKTYKVALVLLVACIAAGCGSDSGAQSNSLRGLHYSDVVGRLGEPRQVIDDGTGGEILSWSPFPIDEETLQSGDMRHDTCRMNAWGYVYDLP